MTYVLGLGGLGYKDSAAAILSEGRVVAAAAEERFSGVKHDGGFPYRAVHFCLERAGVSLKDLSGIAVANNSWLPMREKVLKWYGEGFLRSRTANVYNVFKDETHRLVEYLKTFEQIRGQGIPVTVVRHHLCHMAAAFLGSPFATAAILNIDGRGEMSTSSVGRGHESRIDVDAVAQMPDSLGLLYALVADYLGYSDLDDEFRLISMSPSGTPTFIEKMGEVVRFERDGSYKLNPDYFGFHQGRAYLSERFTEVFGPPREPTVPLEDRHRDLAASVHAVIMNVIVRMTEQLREKSGESRLCLGGGLAQNWAMVGALADLDIFEEVYVPPAPGDDGTALGAALWLYHADQGHARLGALLRADFGPAYPESEIRAELERLKLKASKPADLALAAAERIASGEILGWFQGAAEFGQRALGHRSILADPTDPATRPRLVSSVKARSELHPFGLSVTAGAATQLFEKPLEAPFLERTARLREDARPRLPAVAAREGHVRVQTVDPKREPLFHELLEKVGARTGVEAVLNTSLNQPGRPIATKPREAIGSLFTTGLDALAIGPFIVAKRR